MSFWHQVRCVLASLAGGSQEKPSRGCCAPSGRRVVLEALEDRRLLSVVQADGAFFDFGDAPASYATTLAADGARHVATGPMLGSVRDAEADGTASVNADGDDVTGVPNDEDGVTFGTIQVGQLDASVTVNVQNAPSGAKLDAWIDFKGDGSWGGAGEQIADTFAVVNGDNLIEFDVPSWAVSGETYARFRLSTSGDLAPGCEAVDGEVEDYALSILPPALSSGYFGSDLEITSQADGVQSVFAADLDGDGDQDVLSAFGDNDKIAWYENNGGGNFGDQQVITTNARYAVSAIAADLDGDGDVDVLSASLLDDKIAWYENDGDGGFGAQRIITTIADGAHSVFAADLDGDGDLDVLSASADDDKIAWYENDGVGIFGSQQVITTDADGSVDVFAADLDGDGDLDVLSASYWDDKIAWYENDGEGVFGSQQVITTAVDVAFSVIAADLDGDGDMDVLSTSYGSYGDGKVAWYENNGEGAFGSEQVIATTADHNRSLLAADLDGDGDLDVLSASSSSLRIALYKNNGGGTFGSQQDIPTDASYRAHSVFATDLDGDGDLDILFASPSSHRIAWHENGDDFGDAPAPYATLLADDGAIHGAHGPRLGALRDSERDGLPGVLADGDDLDGSDDEDGIGLSRTLTVGQTDAIVTVNVQNAPDAMLDAWIDFDGDGSWDRAGEQIAVGLAVAEGSIALEFDVPSWAVVGETYARFRLSTAGGLAPTGPAVDGEVEDYLVSILAPALPSAFFGTQQVIPTEAYVYSVFAADLDGDGDQDVLSATGDRITWSENSGGGSFGSEQVITTVARGARSVFAADLDGDGDLDVLSASYYDDKIAWYENIGEGTFGAQRIITTDANEARSVFAADLNGDGDLDVLSVSDTGYPNYGKIAWYENDGEGSFGPQQLIGFPGRYVYSVFAADLDGDGDQDVLSASGGHNKVVWYENNGGGTFTDEQVITTDALGATCVFAADLDGDGDLDVLSGASPGSPRPTTAKFAWCENNGEGVFGTQQIIAITEGIWGVFAGDLDGDGDMDALSASWSKGIAWHENNGRGTFGSPQVITTAGNRTVLAADLDGDGDLDVLSASPIAWYENLEDDLGDAPASYATLRADDGAHHRPAGPTLGSTRDGEQDGQPTHNADGDDVGGAVDDEDGVTVAPLLAPGIINTTLAVEASAASFLNAWIDFNADGDWDDPGEQVALDTPLNAGSNGLSLNVPISAVPGLTYARLRLTSYDTLGMLAPTGEADDGEVEDYAWTIEDELYLYGSDLQADDITVWVGTPGESYHQVDINGVVSHYDAAVYNVIRFDGLGGNDTITVHGTAQNETVTLQPGSVDVVGQSYRLEATGVENVTVDAGTGDDQVSMTGSAGSNRLYSYGDYARLADSPRTFSYRVDEFDGVSVEAPGTGRDYAFLYDTAGDDELDAGPEEVVFRRGVGTAEETVTTAAGFQRVYAYATEGGDDAAVLTGGDTTRNRFYGYGDYSLLTESRRSFYLYARGFGDVAAVSPGDGTTYAYLYDSAGVDALEATPDWARMDRAEPWGDATATGFARVYGYSTRGGEDTAVLTGAATGGNQYRGYPSYSTLTDGARSFYHYARGFSSVEAVGSQVDTLGDRAFLYDSAGDDVFAAAFEEGGEYQGGVLTDAGGTYENWVRYFDLVYARSSDSGTSDAIDVEEELLAYELIRMGTW